MTDHDDRLYLAHIAEIGARIESSGLLQQGRSALVARTELYDATMYRLQTLAESTQRLSDRFKAEHPDIPWRDVGAFRNHLVHGYLGVNPEVVWGIVEHDLPALVAVVRQALELELSRGEVDRGDDLGMDI